MNDLCESKLTEQLTRHSLEESKPIQQCIDQVAPLNIDILLEGETGTGKDTMARRIHHSSNRQGKFIAINCGAIPEQLAESELFGVMPGAYTGAIKARAGYIESAQAGTLYLDEMDSMSLPLQAKLLKVLEMRGIERLGCTTFIPLDIRIVAATQTPLHELVEAGCFRRDLYYRLNVIKITLPPLRMTPEKILPLFISFTQESAKRHGMPIKHFDTSVISELLGHQWPGNIRELKYAAERYALSMPIIETIHNDKIGRQPRSLKENLRKLERILIQESFLRNSNSIDKVIKELDIPKRTLYHRLKSLDIALDKM